MISEFDIPQRDTELMDEEDIKKLEKSKNEDMMGLASFFIGAGVAQTISYTITNNFIISIVAGLIGGFMSSFIYSIRRN